MKVALFPLLLLAFTAGCASTTPVVPALDGSKRVPVNRVVPATAPFTAPHDTTAEGGDQ